MYILAFETTGPMGSVALYNLENGQVVMEQTKEPMGHLKNLMPMAQELMAKLEAAPKEIAAVAASVGPGSYTGIRIGVSSARAIAQALQIPAISVGALDQFRLRCDGKPVAAIFNARRGQVYGAVFDGQGQDIMAPGPYMLTDVLEVVDGTKPVEEVLFYGDGVDAYQEQLAGYSCASEEVRYPSADLIAKAAAAKWEAGETVDALALAPEYMRETEAEQKLRDGTLARQRAAKMAKFRSR